MAEPAGAAAASPSAIPPATLPVADAEPGEEDDDLDALLQAAALGDFDEEAMLVAGGDDEDGTTPVAEPAGAAAASPSVTPPATLPLADDEPDEDSDELDDELKALLQAALALEESGEETVLIAGGDDEDEAEVATEPVTAIPANRPVPDEFDAMLDNLANRDATQAESPATGGEALELDIDDILSDLALLENDAAATDETPAARPGRPVGEG